MAATAEKENPPFFVTPPKDPTSEEFFNWRQMNDMIPDKGNYKRQGLKEVRDFNRAYQDNLEKYKAKYKNCNEFKKYLETNYKGLYEIASEDFEDYKFKTSKPKPILKQLKSSGQRQAFKDITNSPSKQKSPRAYTGTKNRKHTKRNKKSKRNKRSKRTKKKSNKRSKKR